MKQLQEFLRSTSYTKLQKIILYNRSSENYVFNETYKLIVRQHCKEQ